MRGRGHEIPQQANGDVIVMIRCAKHATFTRVGADLAMNYTLSLKEALCGYDIRVRHLSGKILRIKSKPKEIVQHEETKIIYSQGMPQKGNTHVKGHLYIKFKIKLPSPDAFNDKALAKIKELLPDEKKESKKDDAEMKEAKKKQKPEKSKDKKDTAEEEEEEDDEPVEVHVDAEPVEGEPEVTPASSKSAYDEDEEEQQGVQCRHIPKDLALKTSSTTFLNLFHIAKFVSSSNQNKKTYKRKSTFWSVSQTHSNKFNNRKKKKQKTQK
ncbi:DnaJ protein [Reticulomyxa filosa]|uniref:DnaJ protein n=1 Tax=Reticulomyxa filosa TaxID=46433 RepID=X6MV76_RETFI|nr:DnaJ protein [Reticulomyxa filosa]|eukprot:ETO17005.1 DnaJ protein [Reticulomyxa filosa]